MSSDKIVGILLGLFMGSILGSLAVIWFPNKEVNTIQTTGSVNAENGQTQITEISYKNGRCHLSKDVVHFPQTWGGDATSIYMRGSYICDNLDTIADVIILKKALDKAVELGWVK